MGQKWYQSAILSLFKQHTAYELQSLNKTSTPSSVLVILYLTVEIFVCLLLNLRNKDNRSLLRYVRFTPFLGIL